MSVNPALNVNSELAALAQTFTTVVSRSQEARIAGTNSFLAMLDTSRKQNEEQRQYSENTERKTDENISRQNEVMQHREQTGRSVRQHQETENYETRLERKEQRQESFADTAARRNEQPNIPPLTVRCNDVVAPVFADRLPLTGQNEGKSAALSVDRLSPARQSSSLTSALHSQQSNGQIGAVPMTSAELNGISVNSAALHLPLLNTVETTVMQTPSAQTTTASMMTVFTAAGRFLNGSQIKTKEKIDEAKKESKRGIAKSKTGKGISSSFGAAVFSKLEETDGKALTAALTAEGLVPRMEGLVPDVKEKREDNELKKRIIETLQNTAETKSEETKSGKCSAAELAGEAESSTAELAGEAESSTAELAGEAESSTAEQYERVQFVQRIAAACQSAAQQNGTVRFKLSIGDNETLTLRVKTLHNKKTGSEKYSSEIAVRFETTSKKVADLLSSDIELLISTLAEQGTVLSKNNAEIIIG